MSAGGLHGTPDIPSGSHLYLFYRIYRSPKEFLPVLEYATVSACPLYSDSICFRLRHSYNPSADLEP